MTLTRYTCDGCGAALSCRRHLDRESTTAGNRFQCTYCGTVVPGVVAEKLNHQRHHEVEAERRRQDSNL